MRILLVHNRYLSRGGEDVVFESEVALLREHGHEVATWEEDNARSVGQAKLKAAATTIWSRDSQKKLTELIRQHHPEVVHFHNTFLRVSPAAYYTCQQAGIPVVQTLHNYRFLCPAANLFRDGKVCEECLGKRGLLPSIQHRCWHDSRAQTAVVAAMLSTHRLLKTWQKQVNAFIVLTEFARQKFSQAGLPAEKIWVKPNFVVSSAPQAGSKHKDCPYALYVGRLSDEKGVDLLVKAWKLLPDIPLKIVGDGPLRAALHETVRQYGEHKIEFCGVLPRADVFDLMEKATLAVVPSNCYEGQPTAILEAFSLHLPVIATHHGSMAEMIQHGETGLHFEPYDAADLARTVRWAWEHPDEIEILARNAYQEFPHKYSASTNYQMLMTIYEQAKAQFVPS